MSKTYSIAGNTLTVTITDGPAVGTYSANVWGMMLMDTPQGRVVRMGEHVIGGTKRALMVRVADLPGVEAAIAATPIMFRDARAALVASIQIAIDSARGVVNDAHEADSAAYHTGSVHQQRDRYIEQANAVRAELDAFDAAHPEIVAAIETEKAEAAQRAAWS